MVKTDKGFYDRKIVYLDYLERGQKVKNGGFVKWEARGKTSRIQIHIRGLYPTDTLHGEIQLISRKTVYTTDSVKIDLGSGEFAAVWENADLAGTTVSYEECDGVQVKLSESRLLIGQWREREALQESVTDDIVLQESMTPTGWLTEAKEEIRQEEKAEQREETEQESEIRQEKRAKQESEAGQESEIRQEKGMERQEEETAREAEIRQEERAEQREETEQESEIRQEKRAKQESEAGQESEIAQVEGMGRQEEEAAREAEIRQEERAEQREETEQKLETRPEERAEQEEETEREAEIEQEEKTWQRKAGQEEAGQEQQTRRGKSAERGVETGQREETERKASAAASDRAEAPLPCRETGIGSAGQNPQYRALLSGDKWEQLNKQYPHIHPFGDAREYLSITPRDFVILSRKYQELVQNSFLLHGYYNYGHVILTRIRERDGERFYLGVPGVYYTREKQAALMFGFEGFEAGAEQAVDGGFGYYMKQVDI